VLWRVVLSREKGEEKDQGVAGFGINTSNSNHGEDPISLNRKGGEGRAPERGGSQKDQDKSVTQSSRNPTYLTSNKGEGLR